MTRIVIAGEQLFNSLQAEKLATVKRSWGNFFDSESLCAWQSSVSQRGIYEAELVMSKYGWSVRYASGLQGWGLLASSRMKHVDGSREDAERWAREWVAERPGHRYVTASI